MSNWDDPLPQVSAEEVIQSLNDEEIRGAIASLSVKARTHRQKAAVLEVLIEELQDSLYE